VSRVAFVRNAAEVKRAVRLREPIRLVATHADALVAAESCGLEIDLVDRWWNREWAPEILAAASAASRDWWQTGPDELRTAMTSHCGVEVWRILELPLYHVVSEAAYAVLLAEQLLDEFEPKEIVVCGRRPPAGGFWIGFTLDLRAEAVALVAARRRIPVRVLPAPRWVTRPHPGALVSRLDVNPRATRAFREPGVDVLVHAEGRHLMPLLPVLDELVRDTRIAVIADDLDLAGRRELETRSIQLLHAHPRRSKLRLPLYCPALPFRDYDLAPLVRFQLEWLVRHGVAEIDGRLGSADRTLQSLSPHTLLLAVDTSVADLSWVLPAHRLGIPTLTQLHGSLYIRPRSTLWSRGSGGQVAVWGPLTRDWHATALSLPAELFVPVGYPRFDELVAAGAPDRASSRAALGAAPDDRVLLFLVSMAGGALASLYGSSLSVYDEFLRGATAADADAVVVRTHQATDARVPQLVARRHPLRVVVNPPLTLEQSIAAADVVVGQPTTAMLEAMVLEKPTILFTACASSEVLWWLDHVDLPAAGSSAELAAALQRLSLDPSERERILRRQKELLSLCAGTIDGGAGRRTADLVRSLAATMPRL
jgi:hypothetical protein